MDEFVQWLLDELEARQWSNSDLARAASVARFARQVAGGLDDADRQRKRWIVETLDVTVRLERHDAPKGHRADKIAHIFVGDAFLGVVSTARLCR